MICVIVAMVFLILSNYDDCFPRYFAKNYINSFLHSTWYIVKYQLYLILSSSSNRKYESLAIV